MERAPPANQALTTAAWVTLMRPAKGSPVPRTAGPVAYEPGSRAHEAGPVGGVCITGVLAVVLAVVFVST